MPTVFPVADLLHNSRAAAAIWPGQPELAKQIKERINCANSVVPVLDRIRDPRSTIAVAERRGDDITGHDTKGFYGALASLLADPEYYRLVLYLPFEVLPKCSDDFRAAYLNAWRNLLHAHDMRAIYVDGDILELSARAGDPPRVVKAMHLLPWLIREGMVEFDEVRQMVEDSSDLVLKHSFADVQPVLYAFGILTNKQSVDLAFYAAELPDLPEVAAPLYVSENRQKWLETKDAEAALAEANRPLVGTTLNRLPSLAAPYSNNMTKVAAEIARIERILKDNPVLSDFVRPAVLVGGSRVKGYGLPDSDVDVYLIAKAELGKGFCSWLEYLFTGYNLSILGPDWKAEKAYWIHLLFNTVLVGDAAEIDSLQKDLFPLYFAETDSEVRSICLQNLEHDTLLYRLLHKGYARWWPNYNPNYAKFRTIDGASPFYDSGFRHLATKLFVRQVFLPKLC